MTADQVDQDHDDDFVARMAGRYRKRYQGSKRFDGKCTRWRVYPATVGENEDEYGFGVLTVAIPKHCRIISVDDQDEDNPYFIVRVPNPPGGMRDVVLFTTPLVDKGREDDNGRLHRYYIAKIPRQARVLMVTEAGLIIFRTSNDTCAQHLRERWFVGMGEDGMMPKEGKKVRLLGHLKNRKLGVGPVYLLPRPRRKCD